MCHVLNAALPVSMEKGAPGSLSTIIRGVCPRPFIDVLAPKFHHSLGLLRVVLYVGLK